MNVCKKIFKFPFPIRDVAEIAIQERHEILKIECQGDNAWLWAIVDANQQPDFILRLRVFGTGHPLPPDYSRQNYLTTFQQGPFVWHVFRYPGPVK